MVVTLPLSLLALLSGVIIAAGVTIRELLDRLQLLERQALTDPLTGAFNRRHFDASLHAAIERRTRYGEPACLVSFDVDRFKDINDQLGHAAGDAVLKALAVLARRRARTLDTLFRTGGEEFALLLPATSILDAIRVAEQLRARVVESRLIDGHEISISVGVSELRDGQTQVDWIVDADKALYVAKNAGRNRVAGLSPGRALAVAGFGVMESLKRA